MSRRVFVPVAVVSMLSILPAASYARQDPPVPRPTGLVWGGELAAVVSRRDDDAFFNYTDYEHSTLRQIRMRLMLEQRLPARVDLLGEVRVENDLLNAPALFVRWQPWASRPLHIQAGRLPLTVGAFARRAYGSDNLMVGVPLVYQYLTSVRPDALPQTPDDILRMRARGWRPSYPIGSASVAPGLPIVAYSRGDAGVQMQWTAATWTAAAAVTRGTAADPRVRDNNSGVTVSSRMAMMRPSGWTIGVSGARGSWVGRSVTSLLAAGQQGRSTSQTLLGVDTEFARGHWILRGEWWHSSFAVPTLTQTLSAAGGFAEARYRFLPRWQISGRADRLTFSTIAGAGGEVSWDAPLWRVEGALGYRVSRHVDLRAGYQYNWREAGRVRERGFPTLQALLWF
ncbi:MAG TPA: hypothetical protein VMZ90_11180 [Vicinamibacterales bacterium]|nr:hypothetical protein [Vicinamibacterales bacterium]